MSPLSRPHGYATLVSAAAGGLRTQLGVRSDTLAPYPRATWENGAGLGAVVVDAKAAFVGAAVPRRDYGSGRPEAPAGFDGVRSKAEVDPVTGAVIVVESARALRCDGPECSAVIDTGVRFERTITLSAEHAVADVLDRWVSSDERAHVVRVEYTERAVAGEWRFPGSPAFRTPALGDRFLPRGPGTVYVGGEPMGALTFDPAPEAVVFADASSASETLTLTAPATVRRTFALGEVIVQADEPPVETPKPTPPTTDLVFGQDPNKGGVQRCIVPRVRKGATVKTAKAAIRKAGCKVGATRRARSSKVKKGRMIALARTAGRSIPIATAVGIKVSRGKR